VLVSMAGGLVLVEHARLFQVEDREGRLTITHPSADVMMRIARDVDAGTLKTDWTPEEIAARGWLVD
jgi:hypothetical protein